MKIRAIVLPVVAVLALAGAGAGAWALSKNSKRASAIAARVNGEAVLWSEVDAEVNRFVSQVGADPKSKEFEKQKADLTKGIVDQLVLQKLIMQEARKRNVLATDKEVNDQLARIRQQFPNEKAFGDALAKENLSPTTLRELIRFRLTQRRVADAVTKDLKIADDEVRAAFDKDRTTYDKPAQIKVSHILFRVTDKNQVYFIEANPNPILAADEDFAESAVKSGLSYPQLIERIIRLGLNSLRD